MSFLPRSTPWVRAALSTLVLPVVPAWAGLSYGEKILLEPGLPGRPLSVACLDRETFAVLTTRWTDREADPGSPYGLQGLFLVHRPPSGPLETSLVASVRPSITEILPGPGASILLVKADGDALLLPLNYNGRSWTSGRGEPVSRVRSTSRRMPTDSGAGAGQVRDWGMAGFWPRGQAICGSLRVVAGTTAEDPRALSLVEVASAPGDGKPGPGAAVPLGVELPIGSSFSLSPGGHLLCLDRTTGRLSLRLNQPKTKVETKAETRTESGKDRPFRAWGPVPAVSAISLRAGQTPQAGPGTPLPAPAAAAPATAFPPQDRKSGSAPAAPAGHPRASGADRRLSRPEMELLAAGARQCFLSAAHARFMARWCQQQDQTGSVAWFQELFADADRKASLPAPRDVTPSLRRFTLSGEAIQLAVSWILVNVNRANRQMGDPEYVCGFRATWHPGDGAAVLHVKNLLEIAWLIAQDFADPRLADELEASQGITGHRFDYRTGEPAFRYGLQVFLDASGRQVSGIVAEGNRAAEHSFWPEGAESKGTPARSGRPRDCEPDPAGSFSLLPPAARQDQAPDAAPADADEVDAVPAGGTPAA